MTTPFPFVAAQTLTAQQLNDITNLPINDQTASYTAVVGDAGKRIVMNVATANTVTINDSIFTTGDTIFIANKGAGTCTITAGAGVTINTSGSLALAQHGGGTLVALSASTFTFFSGGGTGYGTATGGTGVVDTTVGGIAYKYTSFTSTGDLTITKAGFFDFLIFGGGGCGGNNASPYGNACGGTGGGAGGKYQGSVYLSATTTCTIGAAQSSPTANGNQSSVAGVSPVPGGQSGGNYAPNAGEIFASGRGGMLAFTSGGQAMFAGFYGKNGGGTNNTGGGSGGGGGAVAVGSDKSGTVGGAGGAGFDVSAFIGGSALFKAGGGGGGGTTAGGAGGSSVGGAGTSSGNGNAAGANTASGGGGAGGGTGGAGGSGIIYVRWRA
jgi:hypothetical protein